MMAPESIRLRHKVTGRIVEAPLQAIETEESGQNSIQMLVTVDLSGIEGGDYELADVQTHIFGEEPL